MKQRTVLGEMVRLYCGVYDVSERELARRLGLSESTFSRFVHNENVTIKTFVPILIWLLSTHDRGRRR